MNGITTTTTTTTTTTSMSNFDRNLGKLLENVNELQARKIDRFFLKGLFRLL